MGALGRAIDHLAVGVVLSCIGIAVLRLWPGHETLSVPTLSPREFRELASGGPRLGPENAPVAIVVFCAYDCGFCRELHGTLAALHRRYPEHLSIVSKAFVDPKVPVGLEVAAAGACAAEQGQYEAYEHAAYENPRIVQYSEGWRVLADSAGLMDVAAFESCVKSGRYLDELTGDWVEGRRLGVRVTPTIFLNGSGVVGTPPLAVLDSMVAGRFPGRQGIH